VFDAKGWEGDGGVIEATLEKIFINHFSWPRIGLMGTLNLESCDFAVVR